MTEFKIALQTKILARFLSAEALADLIREYDESRMHRYKNRTSLVTDTDRMIFIDYKNGTPLGDLARKYNKKVYQIEASLMICAANNL